MKQGVTKCEWCLHESNNTNQNCSNCGGPVQILEPWVIQCGWCSSSNRRDLTANCKSCGGDLPHIPGTERLPEPPKSPRDLPNGYEKKILYWKNVYFLIGAGFMIFLFTIIFPIIGFFLIKYGLKTAKNKIFALKHGVPTKGEIQEIYIDKSQHINNVNPVKIKYLFSTPNGQLEGQTIVWDRINLKRKPAEHIWVVFNPDNTKQNNIWPPLH